jgi:hypothetical protein
LKEFLSNRSKKKSEQNIILNCRGQNVAAFARQLPGEKVVLQGGFEPFSPENIPETTQQGLATA